MARGQHLRHLRIEPIAGTVCRQAARPSIGAGPARAGSALAVPKDAAGHFERGVRERGGHARDGTSALCER